MSDEVVRTAVGPAQVEWFRALTPRATVVLGHGTATGVEAADLQELARTLPPRGLTVVLVTQPYRVAGDPALARPAALDAAWIDVCGHVRDIAGDGPLVSGGRSAGSVAACRTADTVRPDALLLLAYPLRGPGSRAELSAVSLPTLVIQGGHDPFGTFDELPALHANITAIKIPDADHLFRGATVAVTHRNLSMITDAAQAWSNRLLRTPQGA
ncbi:alpha/beta hydrolase family protein [Microbacterium gorillae]|uniref:alpha/beta hydrolase family protein n=1 Tax=Microbacterium gorillae TaxID=1231063 RepID=UPI00058DB562|nr:alpha/beta family hydrolase [Microbacterium gorillae]